MEIIDGLVIIAALAAVFDVMAKLTPRTPGVCSDCGRAVESPHTYCVQCSLENMTAP